MKRFVLIDRDGTVIVEKSYLSDPEQLELLPGAAPALRRLQEAGWGLCLLTNQSGIGRARFDLGQLARVHERLTQMLARFDVLLDGIYVCPHSPDDRCDCRKPAPGLIRQAQSAHGFDPTQAWVIGDKDSDVELAHAVGARSILVRTGYGRLYESSTRAHVVADDLAAAVDVILDPAPRVRSVAAH